MVQCIATGIRQATATEGLLEAQTDQTLNWLRPQLIDLAHRLHGELLTPAVFLQRELALLGLLREFGRRLLERLLNSLEPDADMPPHDVL